MTDIELSYKVVITFTPPNSEPIPVTVTYVIEPEGVKILTVKAQGIHINDFALLWSDCIYTIKQIHQRENEQLQSFAGNALIPIKDD